MTDEFFQGSIRMNPFPFGNLVYRFSDGIAGGSMLRKQ